MNAPPTLVITDDDERTIIDPRVPSVRPTSEPGEDRPNQLTGAWWHSQRNRWRSLLVAVAAAALCLSLLGVALQQWRLSDRLQRTIDTMHRASQAIPSSERSPALASKVARPTVLMDARPRRTGPPPASREELELEAATLVIANDHRAALESYLRLAARFRDEPVFVDLITILRAKLACRARRGVEGSGCD